MFHFFCNLEWNKINYLKLCLQTIISIIRIKETNKKMMLHLRTNWIKTNKLLQWVYKNKFIWHRVLQTLPQNHKTKFFLSFNKFKQYETKYKLIQIKSNKILIYYSKIHKTLNKILMSHKINPTRAHKIILLQMISLFVIITVKFKAPIKICIVKEEGNLETNSHKIIKVSHHQEEF
jgi:hypothetical protein